MSIATMISATRIARVQRERGETIELRTPPCDWPKDERGVTIAPPPQLWEPRR
jgi:hypothetical protein